MKKYIFIILFVYFPLLCNGGDFVFDPLNGMSLKDAINKGNINKIFDCYVNVIAEKPYSQKSYFYMTYSLPNFVFLLEDCERKGAVKVSWVKQLQDYESNIKNLKDEKKYFAAKIVMAYSLLESDLHQDNNTVVEILANILENKKLIEFHPLCLMKKITLDSGNVKQGEIEYLDKLSKDYKELKLILLIRDIRGRVMLSGFMSKEREEHVDKWFSYAMSQTISEICYYDNPFPIYEAYAATQCMSDVKTQIQKYKLLLSILNDNNDPPKLGCEYRTNICGDLADIYYEKRDLINAKYYLEKGLKFGKTMHICIIKEKIDRYNNRPEFQSQVQSTK